MAEQGKINVAVENIFPLIKKFLYSDHEIFLRELVSNATDATLKLRHLVGLGEADVELGDQKIEIKIDEDAGTLHVIDRGIGMTEEEVKKYINDIAISGAEEFLEKYKDSASDSGIIGHFGLGFYSAFMVASKVELITKSYKDEPAVRWECDGTPEYSIEKTEKEDFGTEVVLHIAEDEKEFLKEARIRELLTKYNKFMPVPIKFGTKTETLPKPEDAKEDDPAPTREVDDIVNNPNPAWTKMPADLEDKDYKEFYRELYPMQFEEPLFHIHLNVDHPFHLTGILYFPKLTQNINPEKDRIQLYQNQVFVTDNVEGIVPDFLTMLRGVIDSPDIPLNVSRSYLQSDGAVKKISGYITRKVADKLKSLFNEDRKGFEEKWDDIKVVIEYGMITEDKFFDKSQKFALYPTTDGNYYTWDELIEKVKPSQTDKDDKTVLLYASNREQQDAYIASAKDKGYEVLLLDTPIVPHLIQKLEQKNENITFARVDADHIDNLIKKDDEQISKLSDEEKEELKKLVEETLDDQNYTVQVEPMSSDASPFMITQPEFMRRMKDMQATGGGGMMMGNMPDMFNLVVNGNHELIQNIRDTKTDKKKKRLIQQVVDLARLQQGLLKGEALTQFVSRSYGMIK